jgi:hypothetical protein
MDERMVTDAKHNGILQDPVGDTSSKRLAGIMALVVALVSYIYITVMIGTGIEVVSGTLFNNLFYGLLVFSAVAFGLTLPEHWSKTLFIKG